MLFTSYTTPLIIYPLKSPGSRAYMLAPHKGDNLKETYQHNLCTCSVTDGVVLFNFS